MLFGDAGYASIAQNYTTAHRLTSLLKLTPLLIITFQYVSLRLVNTLLFSPKQIQLCLKSIAVFPWWGALLLSCVANGSLVKLNVCLRRA